MVAVIFVLNNRTAIANDNSNTTLHNPRYNGFLSCEQNHQDDKIIEPSNCRCNLYAYVVFPDPPRPSIPMSKEHLDWFFISVSRFHEMDRT